MRGGQEALPDEIGSLRGVNSVFLMNACVRAWWETDRAFPHAFVGRQNPEKKDAANAYFGRTVRGQGAVIDGCCTADGTATMHPNMAARLKGSCLAQPPSGPPLTMPHARLFHLCRTGQC